MLLRGFFSLAGASSRARPHSRPQVGHSISGRSRLEVVALASPWLSWHLDRAPLVAAHGGGEPIPFYPALQSMLGNNKTSKDRGSEE